MGRAFAVFPKLHRGNLHKYSSPTVGTFAAVFQIPDSINNVPSLEEQKIKVKINQGERNYSF